MFEGILIGLIFLLLVLLITSLVFFSQLYPRVIIKEWAERNKYKVIDISLLGEIETFIADGYPSQRVYFEIEIEHEKERRVLRGLIGGKLFGLLSNKEIELISNRKGF